MKGLRRKLDFSSWVQKFAGVGLLLAAFVFFVAPDAAIAKVSDATVKLNTYKAGAAAKYTIEFDVGSSGKLTGGEDEISIYFPDEMTLPDEDEFSTGDITVNGYSVYYRDIEVSGNRLDFTLPSKVDVKNNGHVKVIIDKDAGIKLPKEAGSYYLRVATSNDSSGKTNSFTIDGSKITSLEVSVSPPGVKEYADYEISFKTSSSGELDAREDCIYIQFPSEVTLPSSISGKYIEVNGKTVSSSDVYVDDDDKTIEITLPSKVNIDDREKVTVTIDSGAKIRNPRSAGTYKLYVSTSADAEKVSKSFTIGRSVTVPSVSISPRDGEEEAKYTITFRTSSDGALRAGKDYIYVHFPEDTYIPGSISRSDVTVNGVKAADVTCSRSKRMVTIKVPSSVDIDDDDNVKIIIKEDAGIKNPEDTGYYRLQISTSADASWVLSDRYRVVGDSDDDYDYDDDLVIELSDNQAGEEVSVLLYFDNIVFDDDLESGDRIYVIFPSDFTLPSSIADKYVLVNGIEADDVDRIGQSIAITIPDDFDDYDDDTTVITIDEIAGIKNPKSAGEYSLFVYTSAKPSEVVDYDVTITKGVADYDKVVFKIGSTVAYVGDKTVILDAAPTIVDNYTVVPLRALGDALGAETVYDEASKKVTVKYDGESLTFYLDSKYVWKDNKWVLMDIPVKIMNNRVMIPLRFAGQSFGAKVDWNGESKEITITK